MQGRLDVGIRLEPYVIRLVVVTTRKRSLLESTSQARHSTPCYTWRMGWLATYNMTLRR